MKKLVFDYSNAGEFVKEYELQYLSEFVKSAHLRLHNKTGAGNDYVGWVDLPKNYDREEVTRIKAAAQQIKESCDAFVVIGIGGSYAGSKAAIDILSHSFTNELPKHKKDFPNIYFVGNNMSSTYVSDLLELLEDKNVCINVISKSGSTTEPAIAFRVLRKFMEKRYSPEEIRKRIYITTDINKGILHDFALKQQYQTFTVPDDVGGRYSVLTSVGLLPIAASGADIDKILVGASDAYDQYNNERLEDNDCYKYAAVRNILYRKNKFIEILVNYEPRLGFFAEWWKQLYGESEGKENKGIFPASANFTTDLHSLGQYIQDGLRSLFETVLNVQTPRQNMEINHNQEDIDGLNYIAGKDIDFVNKKAMRGTINAHVQGGVPNLVVNIPELTEYYFGQMVYFFEKACGLSGYLLGVNPFDQQGVEEYKKEMFKLLGKNSPKN